MVHVPRAENQQADSLAKLASALESCEDRKITLLTLPNSHLEKKEEVLNIQEPTDWRWEIWNQLTRGVGDTQPTGERKKISPRFTIIDGVLYRRGFNVPFLRCLSTVEATRALEDIHAGLCGSHGGAQMLAKRVFRAGFYWPTVQKDAKEWVQKCEQCQKYANFTHKPGEPMTPIITPCPFARWGIDIVGPFPVARGQKKFLLVAIDYFTKWVEAVPLLHIGETEMINFLWHNIVTRFGIPQELISDNGRQFQGNRIGMV